MQKYKFIIRFFAKILIITGISLIMFTFVVAVHRTVGNGMFPNVHDGDLGIYLKVGDVYADDVVLYEGPDKKIHIGRIRAVGGQTVEFPENGGYTVDGYAPYEDIMYGTYAADGGDLEFEVPAESFFIMNDFRSDTDDSRSFGCTESTDIKGKLMFLLRRRNF